MKLFFIVTFLFYCVTTGEGACGSLFSCPEGYQCFENRCVAGLPPQRQIRVDDNNQVYYDLNGTDYSQFVSQEGYEIIVNINSTLDSS
ncbi:hypothetical protein TcasGA2_TC034210 [Tribolium castaneum]|uniref:Uncharacterized protein n=1 Tax=Tribolium castaneum TaxID=7070 RepID=A0A139W9C6_TRICA|nr:hypothetical protein TcasGA2_TC034210 [Tribolium castaneum]